MYIPNHFRAEDTETLHEFIERYAFATLVSAQDGSPFATHLPLLMNGARNALLGHVARANPHWRSFDGSTECLAVFSGPHGYISPSWYSVSPAVPTWNYAAVHVYGRPTLVDAEKTADIIDALVAKYEAPRSEPWPNKLPVDFRERLLAAIVGFEMPIERIEGKFKLGQNRSEADLMGTIAHLEAGSAEERALAEFTRRHLYPESIEPV
jgi:transcriptional regulator